jgi:hypothetical protein
MSHSRKGCIFPGLFVGGLCIEGVSQVKNDRKEILRALLFLRIDSVFTAAKVLSEPLQSVAYLVGVEEARFLLQTGQLFEKVSELGRVLEDRPFDFIYERCEAYPNGGGYAQRSISSAARRTAAWGSAEAYAIRRGIVRPD